MSAHRLGIGALVGISCYGWTAVVLGEEMGGAAAPGSGADTLGSTITMLLLWLEGASGPLLTWMGQTPPLERVAWGGLAACALLAFATLVNRLWIVRPGRFIPNGYRERFHTRLVDARLDWGQGIDYCELNPSPASRVALAAIRRWGRPIADLERGVALARQIEIEPLRRHVGTLRRVAVLAPLVGLLGSLAAAGRILTELPAGTAWGPAMATALAPLTASVGLAILSLLAYDGLTGRIESLGSELDRLGAETVDALAPGGTPPTSRQGAAFRAEPAASPRSPHAGSSGGSHSPAYSAASRGSGSADV